MASASELRLAQLPAAVRNYLAELVLRVDAVLENSVVGVFLLGSAALGDYAHGESDLM